MIHSYLAFSLQGAILLLYGKKFMGSIKLALLYLLIPLLKFFTLFDFPVKDCHQKKDFLFHFY
jgi:hypothetical protein